MRSPALTNSNAYRPLTHRCPLLTGECLAGFTDTIRASRVPTDSSQPVPQYGQTVCVHAVAAPRVSNVASSRAPVGHVSTHAPQLTHELVEQIRAVRLDPRVVPAIADVPHELSLHLVADAHASRTLDAARHVDRDVRMGPIDLRQFRLVHERSARPCAAISLWNGLSGSARTGSAGYRLASISIAPRRPASRSGEQVSICKPSVTGVAHAGTGRGKPAMRTRHKRQAPVGVRRSSWQSVGRCTPAARSASASDGASGRSIRLAVEYDRRHARSMGASGVPPGNFSIDAEKSAASRRIARLKAVPRRRYGWHIACGVDPRECVLSCGDRACGVVKRPGLLRDAVQRDRHSEGSAALLRADR